ncbi:MAG: carboxypeptidase regulatory-like domain-containing protein [Planctomycetes bacterium]|nr:carboxypeptidase regulatory-like domain-containing protein [Planctomycetota bacterium]
MPEASTHRVSGRSALLVAVAAIGLGVAVWSSFGAGSGGPPPTPAAHVATAVAEATAAVAPADAAAPASESGTDRSEAPSEHGTVRGRLFDGGGAPLAGMPVRLFRTGSRIEGLAALADGRAYFSSTRSDAAGAFVFGALPPDFYEVTADWDDSVVHVELAASEVRDIELRCSASGAVVEVYLRRPGGVPRPRRLWFAPERGSELTAMSDDEGVVRRFLPPGRFRVQVRDVLRTVPRSDRVVHEQPIIVPEGARRLRVEMDLPLTLVQTFVVGASDEARPAVVFTIDGEDRPISFDVSLAEACKGVELWPGRWTVGLRGTNLVDAAPQTVVTDGTLPAVRVDLAAIPAVDIRLDLRRPDRSPFLLPVQSETMIALLPRLVIDGRIIRCARVGEGGSFGGPPLGYPCVPYGRAVLESGDRTIDGAVSTVPFDPIDDVELRVGPGTDRVVVPVTPRAFVDIVACSSSGMQDTRAHIRVLRDETVMQPACSPNQSRWQSFLPPGEYRVLIERESGETENRIFVQRDTMSLRLRPTG